MVGAQITYMDVLALNGIASLAMIGKLNVGLSTEPTVRAMLKNTGHAMIIDKDPRSHSILLLDRHARESEPGRLPRPHEPARSQHASFSAARASPCIAARNRQEPDHD